MNCSHAIVENAPNDSLIVNFRERYEAEEVCAHDDFVDVVSCYDYETTPWSVGRNVV
jgi:uncharacterized protein YutD